MTLTEILGKLEKVKKTGDGHVALCPSHDDSKQSLSITEKDSRILLHCHANQGCDAESICGALSLSVADLFNEPKPRKKDAPAGSATPPPDKQQKLIASYDYRDETNELLYQALRFAPKDFRQRKPNGAGGWEYKLNGTRRVLYRLPEILAADKKRAVFIVEGEKDVETLRRNGLLATSNVGGAGKWREEYSAFLQFRHVVILPDNDEPGLAHASEVALALLGQAASVKIVHLPNLPEKGDVTDWLAAGNTVDDLKKIVRETPFWQAGEELLSDDAEDSLIPFPKPQKACFHGLAGDFVRTVYPHSEADPMAHLIQFLTVFGNIIGRKTHFQVERDKHFTNIFAVLVGNSGAARKGASWGPVRDVFRGIDEHWDRECNVSGLSSGEGLLYQVRDAPKPTDLSRDKDGNLKRFNDEGAADKRALVYETEFAQVLRAQGREGNSLSAYVRNFWDTGNQRALTKNSPLRTTDAHVSILGNVTPTELKFNLGEVETANGYANRFLWVCVRRSKLLPLGGNLDDRALEPIRYRLQQSIDFAREIEKIFFSPQAKKLWIKEYVRLETSRTGLLAKLTQRASPYVLRLAMIFALLEQSDQIEIEHLKAALGVWKYCEDSVRYTFGIKTGDKFTDRLFEALVSAGKDGMTRKQLIDHFNRNIEGGKISAALQTLHEQGLANVRAARTPSARRDSMVWSATFIGSGEDAEFYDFNDFNDLYDFEEPEDTVDGTGFESSESSPDRQNDDPLKQRETEDLTAPADIKVVKVVNSAQTVATPAEAQQLAPDRGKLFAVSPPASDQRTPNYMQPPPATYPCLNKKCGRRIAFDIEICPHCGEDQKMEF